jgi:ubiquinone/menaquinone biosynthesis C-methylase UbiE
MACAAVGSPARVISRRYGENWDFHQRERAALEGMPQKISKYVCERGRRIAEWIREDDHVLDIGCGEGIITSFLARKCRHVVGCDYSAEALETAAQAHPGLEFVHSNSTCLRFESGSFTKVVLSEVAEHLLPVQLVRALHEACRVLRPGGMLILTTPLTGKGTDTSTYAHIYEYSEREVTALLGRVFGQVQLWDKGFGIFVARKRESR